MLFVFVNAFSKIPDFLIRFFNETYGIYTKYGLQRPPKQYESENQIHGYKLSSRRQCQNFWCCRITFFISNFLPKASCHCHEVLELQHLVYKEFDQNSGEKILTHEFWSLSQDWVKTLCLCRPSFFFFDHYTNYLKKHVTTKSY